MTPMALCIHLRVGITHHPLHMASPPIVVPSQATPLLLTPLVQMLLCTQANRGAIHPAHSLDSLTPLGIQEQATQTLHPCPLSSHPPYHLMS